MIRFARLVVLFLLIQVFVVQTIRAQTKYFKVAYIKGKVEVKSKKRWVALKVSDRLGRENEIRLDRNATLHLTDSAGLPFLFTLPGVYVLGDYYDNSRTSMIVNRDGQMIMGKAARMKQTFFASDAPIKVLLPRDSTFATVYAKMVGIRWIDHANKGPYIVTIKTLFKETIATYEVSSTEMTFDPNQERFQKERVFYVIVSSVSNPKYKSHEHVFKRIPIHERYRDDDILNKEIILDNSSALDQLILAGFYEDQALYTDAVNAYLEAIRIEKDDPVYAEAFTIFLRRYGLE